MKNVIDALSYEAKLELEKLSVCNVGIVSGVLPPHVKNLCAYTIALYDKGTEFPPVVTGGSVNNYDDTQPLPVFKYAVLVNGSISDAGTLKGHLKKYQDGSGYLYKPFDSTVFHDNDFIKYDCSKYVVKLVTPYSFLKGGGRKI